MIKKYYEKYGEIIRYLVVGIGTTLISLLTYYLLIYTIFNPNNPIELQITNVISWITAVTFAFIMNRNIVFKSKGNKKVEAVKFYLSRLSTLLIDMLCMFILVTLIKFYASIAKLLVQIIILILNYLISKLLIFKKIDYQK